jgi:hypothetical protein
MTQSHHKGQTERQPTSAADPLGAPKWSNVDGLVEAIAERVVELLAARLAPALAPAGLLTAAELADELSVARSFVYEHADELGAVRLGGGSKPRLRFDLEAAQAALVRYGSGRSQSPNASQDGVSAPDDRRRRRRTATGVPKPGSVLAVRGDSCR